MFMVWVGNGRKSKLKTANKEERAEPLTSRTILVAVELILMANSMRSVGHTWIQLQTKAELKQTLLEGRPYVLV